MNSQIVTMYLVPCSGIKAKVCATVTQRVLLRKKVTILPDFAYETKGTPVLSAVIVASPGLDK